MRRSRNDLARGSSFPRKENAKQKACASPAGDNHNKRRRLSCCPSFRSCFFRPDLTCRFGWWNLNITETDGRTDGRRATREKRRAKNKREQNHGVAVGLRASDRRRKRDPSRRAGTLPRACPSCGGWRGDGRKRLCYERAACSPNTKWRRTICLPECFNLHWQVFGAALRGAGHRLR